jgi:hypothetical protein
VTGAVVAIAEAIRWPVAVLMLWGSAATLAAVDRCPWPQGAMRLLDLGDVCSRVARRMLSPRS